MGEKVDITFILSWIKRLLIIFSPFCGPVWTCGTETSGTAEPAATTALSMMLCTDKYFQLRSTIICLSNGQIVLTKVLWRDPVVLACTNWSLF